MDVYKITVFTNSLTNPEIEPNKFCEFYIDNLSKEKLRKEIEEQVNDFWEFILGNKKCRTANLAEYKNGFKDSNPRCKCLYTCEYKKINIR